MSTASWGPNPADHARGPGTRAAAPSPSRELRGGAEGGALVQTSRGGSCGCRPVPEDTPRGYGWQPLACLRQARSVGIGGDDVGQLVVLEVALPLRRLLPRPLLKLLPGEHPPPPVLAPLEILGRALGSHQDQVGREAQHVHDAAQEIVLRRPCERAETPRLAQPVSPPAKMERTPSGDGCGPRGSNQNSEWARTTVIMSISHPSHTWEEGQPQEELRGHAP